MKYRIAQYAAALRGALTDKKPEEQRAIARRFAAILARHRMIGKTDLILKAYEKLARRKTGTRHVRIESPDPVGEEVKKEIRNVLGAKIYFEEVLRPDLLAGAKILVDDELLIDASAKRQLDRMFTHGN